MLSKLTLISVLALTPLFAQAPAPSLPVGVAVFGEFNQLGTPRFTGGVMAIYEFKMPLINVNMYGTTVADIVPKAAVDPATGRNFYAFTSAIRQGVHKSIFEAGKFQLLTGGDVGPSFSQAQPSGIGVNLSSSFVATVVCHVSQQFSLVLPFRMLYISNIGWNPVTEFGVIFKLSK